MKAIELLIRQHTDVVSGFLRARTLLGDEQATLLADLARELIIHLAIEEQHLYPAYRRYGLPEAADEAVHEHNEARQLLRELMDLHQNDPHVQTVLDRLDLALREHVGKEEGELFPWVRARVPDEELEAIGEAMEEMARRMQEDRELFARVEQRGAPQPA
jgi:iron-sulfur cluster repair protein YtfE (RIC family)